MTTSRWVSSAFASLLTLFATSNAGAELVFSASGPLALDIVPTLTAFRGALGTLNPNTAVSFGSGRREINWDGVPAAFSAPNNLPANFFNSNSPRGVVFSTAGTGFQVSGATTDAGAGQPAAPEFGNINPTYTSLFAPFSPQRLFTPLGSNITDINLFIPGSLTGALTRGFGIVFSDVDLADTTSLQFFDRNNNPLGTPYFVPNSTGNETFSFLGVDFGSAVVSRVRVTSGNQVLAAGNILEDLVVMDDFVFGEPTLVPEPATLALAALALIAAGLCRRRAGPEPVSR